MSMGVRARTASHCNPSLSYWAALTFKVARSARTQNSQYRTRGPVLPVAQVFRRHAFESGIQTLRSLPCCALYFLSVTEVYRTVCVQSNLVRPSYDILQHRRFSLTPFSTDMPVTTLLSKQTRPRDRGDPLKNPYGMT